MYDVSRIISAYRNEADSDFLNLPSLATVVQYDLNIQNPQEIRRYTLEVVKGLMARGVYPGDYGLVSMPEDEDFRFWTGKEDDHLKRIETEWIAMGHTPNLGEPICWFALRPSAAA